MNAGVVSGIPHQPCNVDLLRRVIDRYILALTQPEAPIAEATLAEAECLLTDGFYKFDQIKQAVHFDPTKFCDVFLSSPYLIK